MRRLPTGLIVWAAAVLVTGCRTFPAVPTMSEAARDLTPYDLRLGLMLTDETKAFLKQAASAPQMVGSFPTIPLRPFDETVGALDRGFKVVMAVDSLEKARVSGADLIGVLDLAAQDNKAGFVGNVKFGIKAAVRFETLDGKPIESIQAEWMNKKGMFAQTARYIGSAAVSYRLMERLAGSSALAKFEKTAARSRMRRRRTSPRVRARKSRPGVRSKADSPSYRARKDPDSFALVVGIGEYQNVAEARFAGRDAWAFRKHLLALGVPVGNVLYIDGQRAGRTAIEKYLESWLPRNVRESSRVYFYFAGHGAPDAAAKKPYLLPWDGDPKFLKTTGYPLDKLYKNLNKLKAREIVVVLDACFSGAGGRSVLAEGTRPLVMKAGVKAAAAGRVVVIQAAQPDQVTGFDERQGHGLFTLALLRGLNRAKGRATLRELFDGALPEVQASARREGREQTPSLAGGGADLPLSRTLGAP